jgi:hypothetical protein
VLVTHSQNCDQELERPLRRAVVMNQLTLTSRKRADATDVARPRYGDQAKIPESKN